jgi:hypothetical protein
MALVLTNLRALPYEPAVLVISHDETVLEHADRAVTLGDGVGRELPSPAGRGVP